MTTEELIEELKKYPGMEVAVIQEGDLGLYFDVRATPAISHDSVRDAKYGALIGVGLIKRVTPRVMK